MKDYSSEHSTRVGLNPEAGSITAETATIAAGIAEKGKTILCSLRSLRLGG
jgi:hypothetical protein